MTLASAQHLAMTDFFIQQRPASVTVTRSTKQATAAGGYLWTNPTPQAPQTVRVVELQRLQSRDDFTTIDGRRLTPTHVVIAMPDASFERHDQFEWDGQTWEVGVVSKLPEWRLQAEVVGLG